MKNNLGTLSILHYVYGGLVCFIGIVVLLILLFMGQFLQADWFTDHADAPPAFVGGLLRTIGWIAFLLIELKGVANIISASLLVQRRGRLFSQIVAGVNCLKIPFGLVLGIFTFIELNKEQVKEEYRIAGVRPAA